MGFQYPSIGRIVHFYLTQDDAQEMGAASELAIQPYAGIVTHVYDASLVDLQLFGKAGEHERCQRICGAAYSEEPRSGCWRWPPMVRCEPGDPPAPEEISELLPREE